MTGLKPKLIHPFSYLTFGTGSCNSIGQNFVMLEAKVILAMILQRCSLQLEYSQKFTSKVRIVLRLKHGIKAKNHTTIMNLINL
jgi:cytochrome P450